MKNQLKNKFSAKDIDLIVYDFDGVLTDNTVLVFDDDREAVFCNRSDGLAISEIKKLKIPQVIISTEKNKVVAARGKKLGIKVIQSVNDKKTALLEYCRSNKFNLKRVAYLGNDINDYAPMKAAGYCFAPLDAHPDIKKIACKVISVKGGCGVVRAFYDMIK